MTLVDRNWEHELPISWWEWTAKSVVTSAKIALVWWLTFDDKWILIWELANAPFDRRVKAVLSNFPEYLIKINEEVESILNELGINNPEFKNEVIAMVRNRVEWIIWDNTYNIHPSCSIEQWGDWLSHLLEIYWWFSTDERARESYDKLVNLQETLILFCIELAWICFYNSWFQDKWIFLLGKAREKQLKNERKL